MGDLQKSEKIDSIVQQILQLKLEEMINTAIQITKNNVEIQIRIGTLQLELEELSPEHKRMREEASKEKSRKEANAYQAELLERQVPTATSAKPPAVTSRYPANDDSQLTQRQVVSTPKPDDCPEWMQEQNRC